MSPSFVIDVETGAPACASLAGELDLLAAGSLSGALDPLIAASTGSQLLLRCHEVTFIDSAGLMAILRLERHASERGVALKIAEPSVAMAHVLRLTATYDALVAVQPPAAAAR